MVEPQVPCPGNEEKVTAGKQMCKELHNLLAKVHWRNMRTAMPASVSSCKHLARSRCMTDVIRRCGESVEAQHVAGM